jgi:hypothetical protein
MPDINIPALVSAYEAGTSMRELAASHHISLQRVRRILIDAGAYANDKTVYAQRRLDENATLDEIAAELGITRNALLSNLPHTKGIYGSTTPTANATRIRAFRARKKED